MRDTIEESLRAIEHWAAMLRYLTNIAAISDESPDPEVFAGISETCEDIEEATRGIRRTLRADALDLRVSSG